MLEEGGGEENNSSLAATRFVLQLANDSPPDKKVASTVPTRTSVVVIWCRNVPCDCVAQVNIRYLQKNYYNYITVGSQWFMKDLLLLSVITILFLGVLLISM